MTEKEKLEDLVEVIQNELKRSLKALWSTDIDCAEEIFDNRHYIYHALEIWHTREKTIRDALAALENQSIEQP